MFAAKRVEQNDAAKAKDHTIRLHYHQPYLSMVTNQHQRTRHESYYRTPPLSHFRHRYSTCAFQPTIFSSGPRRVTRNCRCTRQRELSAPKRIRLTIISTLRRILLVGAMMKAKRGILRNTLRWCMLLPRPPFWFLIFLAWHSG